MTTTDVIIIGAGLSGLCAAKRLTDEGLTVIVLEARDRVGGRTLSQPVRTDMLDLGAQWIGAQQKHITKLVDELGVRTFPQFSRGKKLIEIGGKIAAYRGSTPTLPLLASLDLQWAITRLDWLSKQIDPAKPDKGRRAVAWDRLSVRQWQETQMRAPEAKAVLDVAVRAIFAVEPNDLSLLHFLHYLRAGGGLMKLVGVKDGAQQDRLLGGAQQLSVILATQLYERKQQVVLGAPVHVIQQEAKGVIVRSAKGDWRAQVVIVAIPPILAGQIDYQPGLPPLRQKLHKEMPMGAAIKFIAVYRRPFWRDDGLSGEIVSHSGRLRLALDNSPLDGSFGAIVGFLLGDVAKESSTQNAITRQETIVSELVRFLGPQAAEPLTFVQHDWISDPWSRGGYAGYTPPGVLSQVAPALRQPCGRIHWAGTETATESIGYMDGAVQAGYRAAKEVVARFK